MSDFKVAKNYFKSFFNSDILCELPFLKVFEVIANHEKIEFVRNLNFVTKISQSQNADVLLKKSRAFLKIDDLHKQGFLGQNVTVAIIDTGCHPHLDFVLGQNRILFFKDFLENKQFAYDDNGHGTFVAGVVGGSGLTYGGKFKGVAPECKLVVLKALNKDGETKSSTILMAMQWILDNAKKFNIKIVCMSFGSTPQQKDDPLVLGAEMLWQHGIVVVCAAGNDGPKHETIKSPGVSPRVITVGSAEKLESLTKVKPANFSSRGPAFDFFKPDVLAPGVEIVSTTNTNKFYTKMSGTSVSTPFVAGICALVLSKYDLSPNELKFLLLESATKTSFSPNEAGSGFVNPFDLLKAIRHKIN